MVTHVQALLQDFSSIAYVHRFPLRTASDPSLSVQLSGAAGVLLQDFPPIASGPAGPVLAGPVFTVIFKTAHAQIMNNE